MVLVGRSPAHQRLLVRVTVAAAARHLGHRGGDRRGAHRRWRIDLVAAAAPAGGRGGARDRHRARLVRALDVRRAPGRPSSGGRLSTWRGHLGCRAVVAHCRRGDAAATLARSPLVARRRQLLLRIRALVVGRRRARLAVAATSRALRRHPRNARRVHGWLPLPAPDLDRAAALARPDASRRHGRVAGTVGLRRHAGAVRPSVRDAVNPCWLGGVVRRRRVDHAIDACSSARDRSRDSHVVRRGRHRQPLLARRCRGGRNGRRCLAAGQPRTVDGVADCVP